MIIAGSVDNIAAWNDVRTAHWANAPAPGVFAVVHGANHGYFMDYSQSWENGGTATITRAEQQRITRRHLTAYFERYLQGDSSAWNFQYCYGDSIWHHPTMDTVEIRWEQVSASDQPGAGGLVPIMWIQPNPSRGRFWITFKVRAEGPVFIDMYEASGRRVTRIFDGYLKPGIKTIFPPTTDLPAGIYFVRGQDATGSFIRSAVLEP